MIRLHGKRKEPCRIYQASLTTTLRKRVELLNSLRHHKWREAHILWSSHLLVCVPQIFVGRQETSAQGLVKGTKIDQRRHGRALRIFQTKDAVVAKLFAKHIKLREAIEYVKKSRFFSMPPSSPEVVC